MMHSYQPVDTAYVPALRRPDRKRIEAAAANILLRGASSKQVRGLDKITELAGQRPPKWEKPKYGDFEYWLARNCGWITDAEIKADLAAHNEMRQKALSTSHRYKWDTEPQYDAPEETGEYVPEVNMKLIKDRNLTDSARRVALFVMRHTYQDNRKGRFIGMTVTFIMKGLSLSRRTVQRALTILETRGYFSCQVAKGERSRMCIGLIIHLLSPLFPKHYKKKWPESRRKSDASQMPHNQSQIYYIYKAKEKISRFAWSNRCCEGVFRSYQKTISLFNTPDCLKT